MKIYALLILGFSLAIQASAQTPAADKPGTYDQDIAAAKKYWQADPNRAIKFARWALDAKPDGVEANKLLGYDAAVSQVHNFGANSQCLETYRRLMPADTAAWELATTYAVAKYETDFSKYNGSPANFAAAKNELTMLINAGRTRMALLERARLYKLRTSRPMASGATEVEQEKEAAQFGLADVLAWEAKYGRTEESIRLRQALANASNVSIVK